MGLRMCEDNEHLWLDVRQFISLGRFLEATNEHRRIMSEQEKEIAKLTNENLSLVETIKVMSRSN